MPVNHLRFYRAKFLFTGQLWCAAGWWGRGPGSAVVSYTAGVAAVRRQRRLRPRIRTADAWVVRARVGRTALRS
jgi:hypothetical protein